MAFTIRLKPLFTSGELREFLDERLATLKKKANDVSQDILLREPLEVIAKELVEAFTLDPLHLDVSEGAISVEQRQAMIPIAEIPHPILLSGDIQAVPGHKIHFYVPFTGDPELFKFRGSILSSSPPTASVGSTHNRLTFSYSMLTPEDGPRIKKEFEQEVAHTAELARDSSALVENFNTSLTGVVRRVLNQRKNRASDAESVIATFGYRLQRSTDAAQTYKAPISRKSVVSKRPQTQSPARTRLEPVLDDEQYEDILGIVESMTRVLERSPAAFRTLDEEAIRTHFLVQLNGQYEGTATGETFNGDGKTDILIRVDNQNIFIAECKFWRGPVSFTEAINQLLGYTSWRDTKTAILLFNRDTQMSTVLAQIPSLLSSHSNFRRHISQNGPARFRAILSQPRDPARELFLTVLVFDVPT
jgi:hypothetical protein